MSPWHFLLVERVSFDTSSFPRVRKKSPGPWMRGARKEGGCGLVISTQGNGLLSPKVTEVRCEVNFPHVNHSHLGYLRNVS